VELDAVVELVGTTRDLYGVEHEVADTFDLARWWREIVEAQQRFREDPQVVVNRELKDLREAAEGIHEVLARHLPRPEQE
jgi:hypothetical protein